MKDKLRNYVEELVWANLDTELDRWKDICTCDRCKLDIATYALNHIRPRYFDTTGGQAQKISQSREGQQLITDVILGITAAIRVVAKNPHHKPLSKLIQTDD
ncbi:MAG: competence protein ComFB [Gemmatimonadetes bacterium]|nr:MAG: competence protein ComFB [Gemmatimonadota bacterium]